MKKHIVLLLVFSLLAWAAHADIADQVLVVRSEQLPQAVLDTYERIAIWMENSGNVGLADQFRSHALGGFGSGSVIRTPGGRILILTNYHVVTQAKEVTVEYAGRSGSGVRFENCRVIAADIDRDLALVEIPPEAAELSPPLEFNEELQRDGSEVWSAGFPGLISSPSWQFAKGTVTNQRAVVKELRVPDIDYVIQHSALIDSGSSGGPLLSETQEGIFTIVGVNTWRVTGRDNTYFAIPAADAVAYIAEYGDMAPIVGASELEEKLRNASERFLELFAETNENNFQSMKKLLSDDLVSQIGWDSYISYRKRLESEERDAIDENFLARDAYDAMREAVAVRLSRRAGDDGGRMLRIATALDTESTEVVFQLGGTEEVIRWRWEMNRWAISNVSFFDTEKPKEGDPKMSGSGSFDRGLAGISTTIRFSGELPFVSTADSGIITDPNIGFAAAFSIDFFANPFFGVSFGLGYHQSSFTVRGYDGSDKLTLKNIMMGPVAFRGQLPFRLADGKLTLIPWLSAGLYLGIDTMSLSHPLSSFGPRVHFPISAGLEMTTKKARESIIWGIEATYVIVLDKIPDSSGYTLSYLRFGASIRFPIY